MKLSFNAHPPEITDKSEVFSVQMSVTQADAGGASCGGMRWVHFFRDTVRPDNAPSSFATLFSAKVEGQTLYIGYSVLGRLAGFMGQGEDGSLWVQKVEYSA